MGSIPLKVKAIWKKAFAPVEREDMFIFLTLPTVATGYFFYGFNFIFQEIALIFLAVALIWRSASYHPIFWSLWVVLLSIDLTSSWISAANHTWVMWYWAVAMLVASFIKDREERELILVNNARWLLIIIMLVAVFWKVINPYYMDGSFFERNLAVNPLMTTFTHTVTGLPWDEIKANHAISLFDRPVASTISFYSNPAVHLFAIVTTWWVLLIELIIGALLLLYRYKADIAAHIFHISFIVIAYFGAPVLGFAWILTVLGAALCGERDAWLRPAYIWLLLLLCAYGLPWNTILFNWLGWLPLG